MRDPGMFLFVVYFQAVQRSPVTARIVLGDETSWMSEGREFLRYIVIVQPAIDHLYDDVMHQPEHPS